MAGDSPDRSRGPVPPVPGVTEHVDLRPRGEMARLVAAHDWAATPLGARDRWPQSLRTTVDLVLGHHVAMLALWGDDLVQIYNDAYRAIAGDRHPRALGQPTRACWPELWSFNGPIYDRVRQGETVSFEGKKLTVERHGHAEDAWFDLCHSPLRDDSGAVAGVLVTVVEKTQQVRAMAERARGQRLFESIADATPGLLYLYDPVQQRTVYANRRIGRLLGYADRRTATLGDIDEALLHPDDADRARARQAMIGTLQPGEVLENDFRLRHADGTYRWLHTRNVVFSRGEDGRTELVLGLAEDITDRKRAEAALAESEHRKREILESINQGYYRLDADLRLVDVNRRFEEMARQPRAALIGRRIWEVLPDVHDAESYGDFSFDRRAVVFERHFEAIGGWFEMTVYRGADGIEVYFRDINDRKRAEEALRHQLDLNRTITENAADALFLMDTDGRVTFANPAAERLFGWPRDTLVGQHLHEMLHHRRPDGSAFPSDACPLLGALRTGRTLRDHEDTFFRRDGTAVPVICSNAPIQVDDRITGAVLAVHDITERKRAEEHRQLLLAELSHRVKNTLAVVQSIARQTLLSAESPERFHEAFTARLLALSQAHGLLSQSNWEDAALHDVIRAEVSPYANGRPGQVLFDGPDVRLSPRAALTLAMAFHELATNAAKHGALSVAAGTVAIGWVLEGEGNSRRLHITWTERGGPPVTTPLHRGFGSTLIERGLPHELDGEVHVDFRPEGLVCIIDIPLTPDSPTPAQIEPLRAHG